MWRLVLAIAVLLIIPGIWSSFWLLSVTLLLLILISLFNRLWLRSIPKRVRLQRSMPSQAYVGDKIEVELTVHNTGILPVPWLTLQDFVPVSLQAIPRPEYLIALHGHEKIRLSYKLDCKRRGRYRVGPFEGQAGTLYDTTKDGMGETLGWRQQVKLVVYPVIVPLEQLQLPSRLPLGNLRTRQPLLPDPSRIAGVREYQPGDDPRHIDWRNTARLNQLQVRQFERTRIIPLALFLDLRAPDMQFIWRQVAEASIVVAASLANRANELNQAFGLYSNGYDPGWETGTLIDLELGRPEMQPHSGNAWLYEVLDKLAGIEIRTDTPHIEQNIGRWTSKLAWGATIALISFEPYPELVTELGRLRKSGFAVIAIFTAGQQKSFGAGAALDALRSVGIAVFDITFPGELNVVK